SSDPYCSSHLTAVFGPTLSTPGTLSTASPTSVSQSTIRSGGTPNLALTPSRSSRSTGPPSRPAIVLTRTTSSPTSCARSLSPVETTVFMPWRDASAASVPITSSASMPSIVTSGQDRKSTRLNSSHVKISYAV